MILEHFSGERLKAIRIARDLSVNQVVSRLWELGRTGASLQLLKNYEDGVNVPGMEYALSLAAIYDCSVHNFTEVKEGGEK